jgi:type VI secretion system protein ImpB
MSSVHDKLARVRKPRVHITYEVETKARRSSVSCPS